MKHRISLFRFVYTCLWCLLDALVTINCLMDFEQQPIFTSQPADVGPLFSGTRGILQCTASGTPPIQYRWLKNGVDISNKSTTNGGVYLISQADRYKDVGHYQCIAENKLGSVLSNKAFLTVAYMDQLKVQYPVEIRVRAGRAAIIRMPKMFDAYPEPTIDWYAGGALIEANTKFAITKDFNLVVLRCEKADEKSYYVEVTSPHTGAHIRSREIRLYVLDANTDMGDEFNTQYDYNTNGGNNNNFDSSQLDLSSGGEDNVDLEFVVKPNDTIAKLNDNLVKFDCVVNSRKHPVDQIEINWYKDDQLIDFAKTKYHWASRSLEIISVTDQDAGVYTCSAKYNTINSNYYSSYSSNAPNNVLAINASAKLDVYIKPTFKTQPDSLIETDFGKTVQLKCEGISNPMANITWYKNAQPIDFDKNRHMELKESMTKLIINNISMNDQAIYQCFLSNQVGHISASTLIRIISFAPKFTQPIQNQTVYSDSNIELSCGKVDGSPKPKITWIRVDSNNDLSSYTNNYENYENNGDEQAFGTNSNGELVIKNVNMKHQGWYKCEANNLMGKVTAKLFLQVKKKTEIIEPPMNISVTKGQSALFKCTISKEDDVEIELKWKFNDLLLDLTPINDAYESRHTDMNSNLKLYRNGTLQIIEAKNTDIGTYKCIVHSVNNEQAGDDAKTAYLNVVELPYAPTNLNVQLVSSERRGANLTWQSSFDGNSPIIKYIVHARINSFDQALAQLDQSSFQYDWFVIKDNVITMSAYFQQADSTQQHWTIISDLKPAHTYEFRVSAVNGIGEGMPSRSSNNITIPEEIPSMPPQNIQAYPIDSKTIFIQWQAPMVTSWNGRLKGYQIAYSLSYKNSTTKYLTVDDYTQTSANLTDLIVWETYLIQICAFNAKGNGIFNNPPLKIRTKEGIPIRAPNNFKANAINSTCIKMSWSEPPAQFVNGIIQGYKLIFYENNQTDTKQTHTIYTNQSLYSQNLQQVSDNQYHHSWNEYQYQMCSLAKYTVYTLSILCFTSSGDGPLTQPLQLKTLEDVPGEVSDILFNNVYDTSVDIEWKPPLQPNGRILAYVISYKPAGSSSSNSTKYAHIIIDSSQTSFTLHNLKSSTEYIIGIRAKTQAGDGAQKLLQIKSGVPPELPEPPKAIVVRTIGRTSVELEFIPGYNGKTSINKWIVEALIVFDANYNGSKWHAIYERSNAPNATKLTVDNLKPFTNYTLRMYAKNVKGMSKPSQPTEVFQTLADVPSYTPQYLSARLKSLYINSTRANNINVLVKWSPIPTSRWNGIPYGYVLFVTDCTANLTNRIEIKFNKYRATRHLVRGLAAWKCYTISIAAWNNVGLGPKTDESNVLLLNRTSQSKPSNYTYNVNLYTVNSSSIRVTWSRLDPTYANGPLTGYLIRYQPAEQRTLDEDPIINYYDYDDEVNNDANSDNDLVFMSNQKAKEVFHRLSVINDQYYFYETMLSNLLSYTNYKVEIAACTRAGCGQFSLPVSIRTLEYSPSRPIDLHFPYVNLTSVQLEWKPPRYPNGQLCAFRIRYILKRYFNQNQSKQLWSVAYLPVNKTNVNAAQYRMEINGLSKMEYYIFEVSANNTAGLAWGDTARTIVYTIDNLSRLRPDSPSRPSISRSSIKSNELTISWNTNSDNYSPIRYFTVQISEFSNRTDNVSWSPWSTIYLYRCANSKLSNNYRLTVRGVNKLNEFLIKPNGRMYKFRVASTNDIGTSEFSEESNAIRSKHDLPRLNMHSLNVKPIDLNRVWLNWVESILPDDTLIKFKLILRKVMPTYDESFVSSEFIIDYKNTTQIVADQNTVKHELELVTNNLEPNGIYEFELCGINLIGQGVKCATTSSLVYMEDRRPLSMGNLVKWVKPLSSTEINVTWNRVNEELINGNLYGYRVVYVNNDYFRLPAANLSRYLSTDEPINFYSDYVESDTLVSENQFINLAVVEPNQTNLVLNNLKPYKNYTVLVQLINQAGESTLPGSFQTLHKSGSFAAASESNTAQTFESVPSKPARIDFSYIGYNFLNLTFHRPTEPNGVLKSYELWYENMPIKPHQTQTTRIIRQEIITNLDADNQTLFIGNLEATIFYKFKVRCRTSIDWGPYLERIVYTGPKLRKNYGKFLAMDEESGGVFAEAPLAPSKPVYTVVNETHSLLEWKSYSRDYEMFIVEIKVINLLDTATSLAPNSTTYEILAYSNSTRLHINRYDKKLSQHIVSKLPPASQASSSASNILCVFRILSFNSVSISEPSENSELININKLTSPSSLLSISKELSGGQQLFYLNWWFMVIVALASVTFLIIIVLIMLLRGKNKKFLAKKTKFLQQQQQQQQKMNTIKMMKMSNSGGDSLAEAETDEANVNTNSIYLAGSNQQLILTNATNSLSRTTYATNNNPIAVYELRKSKRGGTAANTTATTGTIRTATYVSPNGTLSRINIITNENGNDYNDVGGPTFSGTNSLIKQQQVNGLNNGRNLSNLIGLPTTSIAQPNDYCTSGKIGAIILNDNGTIKSTVSNKNGHYLIPLNTSKLEGDDMILDKSQQHLYFQHMGNYGQLNGGNVNVNFNYSSSDTENDSSSNGKTPAANFNHMSLYNMSKRQIYTTNSFGRQTLTTAKPSEPGTINVPNNLPPPPPSLLTSSIIQTEPEPTNPTAFGDRRPNFNFASTKSVNMNAYFDHQQVMQMQMQQQPMYHTHVAEQTRAPTPPPPPPPLPQPPTIQPNQYRMSCKSPFIHKKPLQIVHNQAPPQLKQQPQMSSITSAASNTVEAISALANAVNPANSSMKLKNNPTNSATPSSLNEPQPKFSDVAQVNNNNNNIPNPNKPPNNPTNNASSISISLSGDRVLMNNVAGSRRPLAGGYSFL